MPPFKPKICFSCSNYDTLNVDCNIHGKEIPESVKSSDTCPEFQVFQFPTWTSAISVTVDRGLSIDETRGFVNYIGQSFKDDPAVTETVNVIADSVDNLEKSLSLSMDEVKEIKESLSVLEEAVGEERMIEFFKDYLGKIEKPSIMDWKYINDCLTMFRNDISIQREKIGTLTAKQGLSIERIGKLENIINLARNTYWLISIIGSILLGTIVGLIISGLSG